jgi:hypothetical protein
MKALVSTLEPRYAGYRICDLHETGFDVASSMFWIDCDDTVRTDLFWYDPVDKTIKPNPQDITEE